ncbi:hypothetical protein FOA52_011183 [Chlamydomonas sp. UWO 241]|nr:hypothetical protein FOA52_011183 [Chlamydomonas sp. UWO 241]
MEMRMRVCQSTAYPALVTACRDEAVSTTVAYVDGGGVGSDPVFNQISTLYNKVVSMSDHYNMSDGSPEVNNVTGLPFGFFHTPLKGFDDGYPLLFDSHVSEKRIVDLLHYVQDGGMLSAQLTRSMTLQMVTYNPEAIVFGYFSATFRWIDSGVISMTSKLMALPAVEYNHGVSSWQLKTLLPDIFFILLIIAYIALTSWDIVASLRSQRKMSHMSKVSPGGIGSGNAGGGIGRMGLAARTGGASTMHSQRSLGAAWPSLAQLGSLGPASIHHYSSTVSPSGTSVAFARGASMADTKDCAIEAEIAEARLEAEDAVRKDRENGVHGGGAVAVRHARKYTATMSPFWIAFEAMLCGLMVACGVLWFMYSAQLVSSDVFVTRFGAYDADAFAPARFLLPMRDESAAAAAQFAAETGRNVPQPGTAGRWRLPADMTGLENAAKLASRADEMYTIYVLYYFFQGFVLLGLILRLIMHLSFQRRLSIIGGTLVALVPELFHFLLVVTTIFCMMAVFLHTIFGYRVYATSTFGEAIFTLFKMLVFGDDTDLYHALAIPGLDAPLERSMASAFRGLVSVLVVWVLRMYLTSFIILIYAGLNQYAKHMPAVSQDLRRMFTWWAQKVRRKAPSNAHIEKLLDKVLEEVGGHRSLLSRVRATVARTVLRNAAGPAVNAAFGTVPYSQSGSRDGSRVVRGGSGGGGIKLDRFPSSVGSKELGAALMSAPGRRTLSESLSSSLNVAHSSGDSGWLSDGRPHMVAGEVQRGSEAGSPLGASQRMSTRQLSIRQLSIRQIDITADGPLLPRKAPPRRLPGRSSSLADILIERQRAAATTVAATTDATPGISDFLQNWSGIEGVPPTSVGSLYDSARMARMWLVPPPVPAGGRARPSDNGSASGALGHGYAAAAAMAAPMPGGGNNGGVGGLTAQQEHDLATIHDALTARFDIRGSTAPASDAASRAGGAVPVVSGARSRKAAAAPVGQHSAMRHRITVLAEAPAETASDDDGGVDSVGREEAARLRHALFRAVVVELAYAQRQLKAMRAAQADLNRLAAELACVLPRPGTVSGRPMLPTMLHAPPPRSADRKA